MLNNNTSSQPAKNPIPVLKFKFAIPAMIFLTITCVLFAIIYWCTPATMEECHDKIYTMTLYAIITISMVTSLCFMTIKLMNHYAKSFNSIQEIEIKLYEEREKYKLKNEKRINEEELQNLKTRIDNLEKKPTPNEELRKQAEEAEKLSQQNQLLQEKINYLEKINERLSKYKTI